MMLKLVVLKLAFGAVLAATLAAGVAYAQDPAAIAKARQGHYKEIGKAAKVTRDQLMKAKPDIAVIQAAAKTIDTLAPQVPTWFPPGTGRDVVPKSEALPVIWQKPDEFKKDAAGFAAAAHEFYLAAQSGKLDAVRADYPTLGGACKTCHDAFKAKDEH
jgi:cytochrome c556